MQPREAARTIWNAGVDEVRAARLVERGFRYDSEANCLIVDDASYPLDEVEKLCVVGAGKAAGYLVDAMEETLKPIAARVKVEGWVNVPDNCVLPTDLIHLHGGRPAGVNEPRPTGVEGTKKIMELVSALKPDDLCICIITGGGSALLPAPADGVTLEDKLMVTRLLSSRGASIHDLNRVRIAMSKIKGGGLRRACNAQRMITLIVSDVIGDPLDLIASGPTVTPKLGTEAAIDVLRRYATSDELPSRLWDFLDQKKPSVDVPVEATCANKTHVLANNELAVRAAAEKAQELGYRVKTLPAEASDARVEEVAGQLMRELCAEDFVSHTPSCLIWGGEPTVRLAPADQCGKGGRNQQLVLQCLRDWSQLPQNLQERLCILSGGTDGEDGPTDAAGAFVDQEIVEAVCKRQLNVDDHLSRNDAYPLLDSVESLVRTGPTHTNVCDIRVAVLN